MAVLSSRVNTRRIFLQHDDPNTKSSIKQASYWGYALKTCRLSLTLENDRYWATVASIFDDQGRAKFPQLCALAKCVLCISHGNSTPERGFSLNNNMLSIYCRSIHENTLASLRIVKDGIFASWWYTTFPNF